MNYQKIYNDLIDRGLARCKDGYFEKHHIIPRCLNGTDDKDNLVSLTPEEHYVAHQLLVKIYPKNYKLVRAAMSMIQGRKSNKWYGWLRRKFVIAQSESQTGAGNSQHGTQWIYNVETEQSKKIPASDTIPEGWNAGGIQDFSKFTTLSKEYNVSFDEIKELLEKNTRSFVRVEKSLKHKKKVEETKAELYPLYVRYKAGESLPSVAKDYKYSSTSLHKSFIRYFDKVPRETGRGNKK